MARTLFQYGWTQSLAHACTLHDLQTHNTLSHRIDWLWVRRGGIYQIFNSFSYPKLWVRLTDVGGGDAYVCTLSRVARVWRQECAMQKTGDRLILIGCACQSHTYARCPHNPTERHATVSVSSYHHCLSFVHKISVSTTSFLPPSLY